MAAQAQAGAAGERKGEARADLLPQVFGVTEYLRGTDNGIGDTAYLPALGVTRAPTQGRHVNQLTETFDNYLAAVSAFQYLFDFGRTRGLVEQRDAEADAEDGAPPARRARPRLPGLEDLLRPASPPRRSSRCSRRPSSSARSTSARRR